MSKKILIVEDEEPLSKILKLRIDKIGLEASIANDGIEGLQALKNNDFDLILLDLIMPRMGGIQFLEKIKKLNIKTPVIILSNLNKDEDMRKARELGAIDYILKSNVTISSITLKIVDFLNTY